MFAMASMEAKTVQFPAGGPYCYKVQGQIHHTVNLAAMVDHNRNERPKYGQLFIVDRMTQSKVGLRTPLRRVATVIWLLSWKRFCVM
ncbi:hypothetical protein L596_027975 [Steinernema carpocapsae]|uniref:Uncharacterized protein n=1 Tax=Steinernema carpocapsae TaxID=34508 RepID=A0A4U5LX55_STECR|nr:hypothetical protein L596_027975 [Steinernema carpocapsae]